MLRVLDWLLIGAFLATTFLLGVFPLKDTDFWWHLRTGDWIRQNGQVPTHDLYTFTVPQNPWIDLHWGFQVALSWGFAHGGVVGLNLAKCAITTLAVSLLITSRRREWPVWVMLLAWLPALVILSGRMYIRPETLTLLYLSADLAILSRWARRPALAWGLPLIQLAWVNTQGLFVLGPILIGFAFLGELVRPDAFAAERMKWWRRVSIPLLATGLACLGNPYGLRGALYPLELFRTMNNPVFSKSIAELTPVPEFIKLSMGWSNVSLRFQIATILLGALSFLIPLIWTVAVRVSSAMRPPDESGDAPAESSTKKGKGKARGKTVKRAKATQGAVAGSDSVWSETVFRGLLFAAFSYLSLQATRNSHQFAAVVGTLTAWNFGEWVASVNRRRRGRVAVSPGRLAVPRLATLTVLLLLFVSVASGKFYAFMGEGRTIGLGEEPLWYPHEAVKFAGKPGMPERFLSFHDGYAPLYEYYNGPERKVFADARLEVMGVELYSRYLKLKELITHGDPSWPRELDAIDRPAVLAGHVDSVNVGVSLMQSSHWRCVWFDDIVAVYVHDAYTGVVRAHHVDFAARHFRPTPGRDRVGIPALLASAKALANYAASLQARPRPDLARPMVLAGLDDARPITQADPGLIGGWKAMGQLEAARETPPDPKAEKVQRYRFPFDPVFDLSTVRATYALRRALLIAPDDFLTLLLLSGQYNAHDMNEASLPLLERMIGLDPININQRDMQVGAQSKLPQIRASLGSPPPSTWENLSKLDRIVGSLFDSGRVASAAEVLERAYPSESRPWEVTDRIATLALHLGDSERARALWENAASPPRPALRLSRIAMCRLVEGAFDDARRLFREALDKEPDLFEARYGLAVIEEDLGRATDALTEARKALKLAPNEVARAAAQVIVNSTAPFAGL